MKRFVLPSIFIPILNDLPFAIFVEEISNRRLLYVNNTALKKFGYSFGYFETGNDFIERTYIHQKHRDLGHQRWRDSRPELYALDVINIPEMEVDILCADGRVCTALYSGIIIPLFNIGLSVYKDISDIKREKRLLKQYAYTDALTGLANRHFFQKHWHEISQLPPTGRLALLIVDLNDFKPVNDTYGHHTGDQALQVIAKRLKNSVKDSDLVCRLGGDEFAILMNIVEATNQLGEICNRIIEAISRPMIIGGITITVTANIGGCIYPEYAEDIQQLLQRADQAMYKAKRSGKSGWQLWPFDNSKH